MTFETFIRLDFEIKILFLPKIGKLLKTTENSQHVIHLYEIGDFYCELKIVEQTPKQIHCFVDLKQSTN